MKVFQWGSFGSSLGEDGMSQGELICGLSSRFHPEPMSFYAVLEVHDLPPFSNRLTVPRRLLTSHQAQTCS